MSTAVPGPKVWTLRFKIHKTTVLLYVEPTQRLSTIKRELLTALRDTHSIHHIQGAGKMYQIPEDSSGVQFAKLVEHDGDRSTWERIDSDDMDNTVVSYKAKGKSSAGAVNGQESKETAQSVGLSDGAIVAVKFYEPLSQEHFSMAADSNDWDVIFPSQEADEASTNEMG